MAQIQPHTRDPKRDMFFETRRKKEERKTFVVKIGKKRILKICNNNPVLQDALRNNNFDVLKFIFKSDKNSL